ncbi:proton-conducting transporter membrane subunit [Bartonella sp. DGB1]|uniref:proton-conducting transporter transmembrane domain-containing protein n=1 Tax=Bartonella sp. DGB1 TaxID=3239807 RepID=UPI00352430CB
MSIFFNNLLILPILIPLITAILLLLISNKYRSIKWWGSFISSVLLVFVCLLIVIHLQKVPNATLIYSLGNLPVPIAITLVADHLSTFFLLITSIILLCSLLFALGHWHKEGDYFYSLVQFLTLGINGCFLTGDLFNLFVFFEIALCASYGLALYGMTIIRLKIILHYLIINLLISAFFLIAIAILYGSLGTLNIAHIYIKLSTLDLNEFNLTKIGLIFLVISLLVKVGMWPLGFWMPLAYARVISPVAVMFLMLSKVSLYIILRNIALIKEHCELLFEGWELTFIFWGGLATTIYGLILALSYRSINYIISSGAVISSGIILLMIAYDVNKLIAELLFYFTTATFALAGLFLLSELINRCVARTNNLPQPKGVKQIISNKILFLGISFIFFAISFIGIPPFAKLAIYHKIFLNFYEQNSHAQINYQSWILALVLLFSGFIYFLAFIRYGIKTFWNVRIYNTNKLYYVEILSISFILLILLSSSFFIKFFWSYLNKIEQQYKKPGIYTETILPKQLIEKELSK